MRLKKSKIARACSDHFVLCEHIRRGLFVRYQIIVVTSTGLDATIASLSLILQMQQGGNLYLKLIEIVILALEFT